MFVNNIYDIVATKLKKHHLMCHLIVQSLMYATNRMCANVHIFI